MASLENAPSPADRPRSIVVTGASTGIGAHCARALKADGWRVFATARKPADLAALEASGIEALPLDYRDPQSIETLVASVLERTGGRLDALYNNGAYAQAGAVEDLPVEALREQFEANVFGWHDLTRRLIPVMRAQGQGRIVNCSSILGLLPARYRGAYCASKYAIEGLTLSLRMELDGSGIHVSLIEPGPIDSTLHENGKGWFSSRIDQAGSVHRAAYEAQMQHIHSRAMQERRADPQAVYVALRHALLSQHPRPHYVVTMPARIGVLLKRLLPSALLYRILARTA
jgi:NAD(P)-dependent dehydrogenase (short-subunit alcohol dehydrogenase family)